MRQKFLFLMLKRQQAVQGHRTTQLSGIQVLTRSCAFFLGLMPVHTVLVVRAVAMTSTLQVAAWRKGQRTPLKYASWRLLCATFTQLSLARSQPCDHIQLQASVGNIVFRLYGIVLSYTSLLRGKQKMDIGRQVAVSKVCGI